MKVISTDKTTFRLMAGDDLVVTDNLPVGTYEVQFSMRQGYWLTKRDNFAIGNKKVYGNQPERIKKIFHNFNKRDSNLGVMLSGTKGMGKTLFSKMVAQEAIKEGIPVINVGNNYPGITDFLDSIKQEALVLIDEFEKRFPADSDDSDGPTQNDFLTLLDGTASAKHLYVATVNKLQRINEYLINRPGRFYYHFRFNYPSYEEVTALLNDAISDESKDKIPEVQRLTSSVSLNYDALLAIANEINEGYGVKDTISDLNIQADGNYESYKAMVTFKNGETFTVKASNSNDESTMSVYGKGNQTPREWSAKLELGKGTVKPDGTIVFLNNGKGIRSAKYDDVGNSDGWNDTSENPITKVLLKRDVKDSYAFNQFY